MDLDNTIEQKLRLGKVDALLLYLASFQTVILTLSQIFLGSWALLYYPAIFVFVAVMPIYIGYVRGAITINSLVERTRGWMYLIFGTVMYLAVLSVWVLGRVSTIVRVAQMVAFTLLGFLLARAISVSGKRILRAIGGSIDASALESFNRTGEAILWMSLVFAFITANLDTVRNPIGALGAMLFIGLSTAAIWNAEKWARLSEQGYVREKVQVRDGRLWWLGILGIGLNVLGGTVLALPSATDILWRASGLVLMLTGSCLVVMSLLFSEGLRTKVRIHKVKHEDDTDET
jgi:hypothetical protein